ncbi:hypothetical protein [Amycolatopsis minnesotensis]|uniref:PE family protein n=1 Tax=Amycolatopsis minnesotensis TaxID=337894 RepID=A0ABN2RDR2_9PSEU
MPDGSFEVDLEQLQRVAEDALPEIGDIMRDQLGVLTSHEGLAGPGGSMAEVADFQSAYATFSDEVAARQKHGCEVVYATAQAASGIVALYRRADGQR